MGKYLNMIQTKNILSKMNDRYANREIDIDETDEIIGNLKNDGSYEVAPLNGDGSIDDWDYTLDEENNIVYLNSYNKKYINTECIVYGNYIINNKTYESRFPNECGVIFGPSTSKIVKLENIKFYENFNTSNITSLNNIFKQCSLLKSLDLSMFDLSNVTSMGSTFYGCNSMETLKLPSTCTGSVTYVLNLFYGCKSLKELDLSSLVTSKTKLPDTEYMFYLCESLEKLNIPNLNTDATLDMNSMFSGCKSLEFLDLTSFKTSKATDMTRMFQNCTKLKEILVTRNKWVIPSGCSTTYMFNKCGCSAVTYAN